MNTFETVVRTDYGDVRLDGDKAQLVNRARKRKRDGQPDMRFKDGKLADFIIRATMERAKIDYLAA